MVRYRILLCRRPDGQGRPYGVAYQRGHEDSADGPVFLSVPHWRTPRRVDVGDLSQLAEEHFPRAPDRLEWSDVAEWSSAGRGAEEFQPTEVMGLAARQQRAFWWQERLRQALAELAARSAEFPNSIAALVRQLGGVSDLYAEAAVEVTLDAASQLGRVVFEPAQACV